MSTTRIRSSTQLNIDDDLSLQNKKIINLADGVNPYDAVNKSQLDNAVSGLSVGLLPPVQNIDALKDVAVSLSLDKYLINVEDSGLFRYDHQSTAAPDDQYVIKPNSVTLPNPGRWVKMSNQLHDHNSMSGLQGGAPGQYYHLSFAAYQVVTRPATPSQSGYLTATDFSEFSSKLSISKFVAREVPTGTINGSNTTFSIAHSPSPGTEHVYKNGLLLEPGANNDYTITDKTITFAEAPQAGDKILVTYWKA